MSARRILIHFARWIIVYHYDLRGRCFFIASRVADAYLLGAPGDGSLFIILREIDPYLSRETDPYILREANACPLLGNHVAHLFPPKKVDLVSFYTYIYARRHGAS